MKSLFIRVLSLLLGCFVFVAIISMLLFWWVSHELDPHERNFQNLSVEVAEEVVAQYKNDNLRGFQRHFRERFNGEAWLFSDQGELLSSRPIAATVISQVTSYPQVVYPYQNTEGRFFIFAHRVQKDDINYKVILTSGRPLFRGKSRFWVIWVPVIIVILAMASASALLSFWMLRPIRTIRNTTQEFSADNIDSRIPNSIADRKDAFGELGREFNQMADRVQSSIDNQNQLLRDVSHELRSPLARIQVAASLATQKKGPQSELDRIESEVEKLNSLIEDLVSLSRLKNRIELEKEDIDLETLLDSVVADANFEYQTANKSAELKIAPNLKIHANRELLSSMFENVIRNGLRYTPENEKLSIDAEGRGKSVVVTITDKGPGVDNHRLQRIFDPFYRGDASRNISNGHHGIGLTLARTIVQLHGGEISARNVNEGGLQINIELPENNSSNSLIGNALANNR